MAREKSTITLDRQKAARAKTLVGLDSTSAVIDLALDRLIHTEQLRRDIAAYRATPPTAEEAASAIVAVNHTDLADDVDWDALYERCPVTLPAGSRPPRRGEVWLADLDKRRR